jgi:hypothetical protein
MPLPSIRHTGPGEDLTCFCTRASGWSSRDEILQPPPPPHTTPPPPPPPFASSRLGEEIAAMAAWLRAAGGGDLRGGDDGAAMALVLGLCVPVDGEMGKMIIIWD